LEEILYTVDCQCEKIALNSVTVVIIPNGPVNSEVNLSMYRDDGRVTAETCVGLIEQKYENKKCVCWLKKPKKSWTDVTVKI
jgi:hypothetical protein